MFKDIPLVQKIVPDEFEAVLLKGRQNYLCTTRLARALTQSKELFTTPQHAELERIRDSNLIGFLRALARSLHTEVGGPGVGAIGMCFSGGFALGMMVDDIMVAPVLSQPSMPFAVGKAARKADLNLSPDDALVIARRAAEGCQVLGLRYDQDALVGDRFASLRALLGDAFIAVELPSTSKKDHSVLTEQRHEPSVEQVLAFLRAKLLPAT